MGINGSHLDNTSACSGHQAKWNLSRRWVPPWRAAAGLCGSVDGMGVSWPPRCVL